MADHELADAFSDFGIDGSCEFGKIPAACKYSISTSIFVHFCIQCRGL